MKIYMKNLHNGNLLWIKLEVKFNIFRKQYKSIKNDLYPFIFYSTILEL